VSLYVAAGTSGDVIVKGIPAVDAILDFGFCIEERLAGRGLSVSSGASEILNPVG